MPNHLTSKKSLLLLIRNYYYYIEAMRKSYKLGLQIDYMYGSYWSK